MGKALIICASVSHGNTRRVAELMGELLGAPVVEPEEVDSTEGYDLIGFGSGIFLQKFHPRLREFVSSLPRQQGRAFVFATSGLPAPRFGPMVRLLEGKGFEVEDTFSCRGFDTWAPFKLVGGIRKGRPDNRDLAAARSFAKGLKHAA
ncbi:flavodoxin family protein [Streptomyces sp. H27-C3]|uniref:flavodoxin family protein n=1 Tax=Streptomyces sp. H27-C3 TaxID=3046305 RepID=UPI0024B94ABC|nr:flavodoxin family protein [Streptomyces sp. H27-C3]MDJ0460741.1 flavodoxin family protein [Streptomyces sp. H27-C3]